MRGVEEEGKAKKMEENETIFFNLLGFGSWFIGFVFFLFSILKKKIKKIKQNQKKY